MGEKKKKELKAVNPMLFLVAIIPVNFRFLLIIEV